MRRIAAQAQTGDPYVVDERGQSKGSKLRLSAECGLVLPDERAERFHCGCLNVRARRA